MQQRALAGQARYGSPEAGYASDLEEDDRYSKSRSRGICPPARPAHIAVAAALQIDTAGNIRRTKAACMVASLHTYPPISFQALLESYLAECQGLPAYSSIETDQRFLTGRACSFIA